MLSTARNKLIVVATIIAVMICILILYTSTARRPELTGHFDLIEHLDDATIDNPISSVPGGEFSPDDELSRSIRQYLGRLNVQRSSVLKHERFEPFVKECTFEISQGFPEGCSVSATQNVILSPPPSRIAYKIKPANSPYLSFGYGVHSLEPAGRDTVTFRVIFRGEQGERILFKAMLPPPADERNEESGDTHLVLDNRVPLTEIAGVSGTLILETTGTSGSGSSGELAFWIMPGIYPERREGELSAILLSIDTLRADKLGCYGYSVFPTSPAIDELARGGVLFENSYANSPWTLPSHLSIFTSQYPSMIGADFGRLAAEKLRYRLDLRTVTLARLVKAAGFHTHAIVSHGGAMSVGYGYNYGFNTYITARAPERRDLQLSFPYLEYYLRNHRRDKFFVFYHTYEVHKPRKYMMFGDWREARYASAVRHVDGYLQRLVELLAELDILDSTLLVVLSDHGEELDEGRFQPYSVDEHGHTLFDEMIKTPLIFSLQGRIEGGKRISEIVRNIDVAPTILDYLAIDPPDEFVGRSLRPLIEEGSSKGAEVVFAEGMSFGPQRKALIEDQVKLIYNVEHGKNSYPSFQWLRAMTNDELRELGGMMGELRVFDLADDPEEKVDLSEDSGAVLNKLLERLGEIMTENAKRASKIAPSTFEMDEEQLREELKALGYVR